MDLPKADGQYGEKPLGSQEDYTASVMRSMFQDGSGLLDFKGLQNYFLPEPSKGSGGDDGMRGVAVSRVQKKSGKAGRRKSSRRKSAVAAVVKAPSSESYESHSDIENERSTLKALEEMLREREEMLTLHEHKVIALRDEYERKLSEIEAGMIPSGSADSSMSQLDNAEIGLRRVKDEQGMIDSLVTERKKELGKLQGEEMRLQMAASRYARELAGHQKKFDAIHKSISQLEAHQRRKQNELDDVSFRVDMKRKENDEIAKELSKARRELEKLQGKLTYDIINEIKILAKRVDDHLRHSDFIRARKDYNRMREFYSQLSRDEKKKVYGKIVKVAQALT